MGSEWPMKRLGDVAKINPDAIGCDWPYPHIHYIDISSVGVGQIEVSPQWMKFSDAPSRAKRIVRKGDTVLSTVRPNRRSMFFASDPSDDWVVSTGFAVLRPNTKLVEPRFLYACVFNHDFTEYLITREKGAAYPAVSPEDISNAKIPFPPLKEQRAIAHILGTLDDKIELNRRMSQTLEEMARAIFKSWFVDFDPVRAKVAVRREHPDWTNAQVSRAAIERARGSMPQQPEIAELFPDRLVNSELGEIPEGWAATKLGKLADIVLGGTPSTSIAAYWDGTIPWAAARDLTQSQTPLVYRTERCVSEQGIENSNARVLPELTTVVTARGTVGVIRMLGRPMAVNQTSYALLPRADAGPLFIYFCLGALLGELKQRSYGTVFDTITTRTLAELDAAKPSRELLATFEEVTRPVMERIRALWIESETMSALRDTLLPKLISGNLRVKDAEKIALQSEKED